jgi:hypothetical protein
VSDDAARRLAAALERRGLRVPGRLLADAHRPLAPLLGDLAAAFGPLLAPVAGRAGTDLATLLDDPRGLDGLVEELTPTQPQRGPRAESR